MKWVSQVTLWFVLVFLLGPFVIIVLAGFSAGESLTFPPQGLSWRWYAHVFTVQEFRDSFWLSVGIGFVATLSALILGVPVAYAISRHRLPMAEAIRTLVTAPIIVPAIIAGLSLLKYFVLVFDMPVVITLFLAHTALIVPYAVRVVSASLDNLRTDIEEASILLGRSRLSTFFVVVLPNIRSAILAAFVLSFITSFNQVPVSLFLTGPGISMLPIQMLWYMEYTYDPSIAALSALLATGSIILVFAAERLLGLSKYM